MLSSTFIIIQARTGSTRLSRKMLRPFYGGKTILQLVIEKLICEFDRDKIVLATTDNRNDDELEHVASHYQINCFRGDEKNVLDRFIKCGERFGAKNIIRVCADNPFLDIDLLKNVIKEGENGKCDYVSYRVAETPAIKTHYGFFTEFVTQRALLSVNEKTKDDFYKEHVTNYIYSDPGIFNIKWIAAPTLISKQANIRLTVDTEEDFITCSEIYQKIISQKKIGYKDVIEYVNSNPEIKSKMVYQIKQNEK